MDIENIITEVLKAHLIKDCDELIPIWGMHCKICGFPLGKREQEFGIEIMVAEIMDCLRGEIHKEPGDTIAF